MLDQFGGLTGPLFSSLIRSLYVIIVLLITMIVARIFRKVMEKHFKKVAKGMKVDVTQYKFFKHVVIALIYIIGVGIAIYMIPVLRSLSVSIFAGAGVLAVIIGFASQQAFSNVISGIFITIFKPFRVDDRIKVKEGVVGTVEDITLRHTVIRNFENKRIIIPNSVISSEIIENSHFGDEKICRFIDFGISYDSDINKAMKIMVSEAMKHPNFIDNRDKDEKAANDPAVIVRVLGFGDSSVNLRAWVWAENPRKAFALGTDLNKSIKEKFDKEGIEIPFPYRTIVYKKDIKRK